MGEPFGGQVAHSGSNKPLVSVIINVRNGAKYLRQAIDSVYAQTYQNFEIIVYDNASTDQTPGIAKGYDGRLKYFHSDEMLLLGYARNNAVEQAKGEFICLLDSDDLFLPSKLEQQVAAFKVGVGIVYSNAYILAEKSGKRRVKFSHPQPSGNIFRSLLTEYNLIINAVMIRAAILDSERKWRFPDTLTLAEECDLFTRIAYRYNAVYIHEPLSVYRLSASNLTHSIDANWALELQTMLERLAAYIPDFHEKYALEIRRFRGGIYFAQGLMHWVNGERRAAAKALLRSILMKPSLRAYAYLVISGLMGFSTYEKLRGWK